MEELVPIDGKTKEATLRAMRVVSKPGEAVTLQAMSRRTPDDPWLTSTSAKIPMVSSLWEALVGAYEFSLQQQPEVSVGP
jgi:hypothetical protein